MSLTRTASDVELLGALDADLRQQVQRTGVDPQRDVGTVRRLAERVVGDHDERSLTGAVRPVPDPEAAVEALVANVAGFGPLQRYLDDPEVEEIWVNDPSRVFVARRGRHELTPVILTRTQVAELVERMLKSSGRRVDISQPFVDALLPGGHRLHVVLEGISRGFSAVNIRDWGTGTDPRSASRGDGPRPADADAGLDLGPELRSDGPGQTGAAGRAR